MYGSKRMCSINWTLITNCTKKIGRWTPVPPPVIRTGGSPLSRLGGAHYPDWGSPLSGLGEPALSYRDSRQLTETIAGSRAEPFRCVQSRGMEWEHFLQRVRGRNGISTDTVEWR